jgi:Rrf2 family protein
MLELALGYGKGPISAYQIASSQGISRKYLDQILAALKAAGLVRVVRGAGGGYTLSRPPDKIRLWEIVLALEGSIDPAQCVSDPSSCPRAQSCVTRDIWCEIKRVVEKVLNSKSLSTLVENHRQRTSQRALMYYI